MDAEDPVVCGFKVCAPILVLPKCLRKLSAKTATLGYCA